MRFSRIALAAFVMLVALVYGFEVNWKPGKQFVAWTGVVTAILLIVE